MLYLHMKGVNRTFRAVLSGVKFKSTSDHPLRACSENRLAVGVAVLDGLTELSISA
jgi:hypothetical protein